MQVGVAFQGPLIRVINSGKTPAFDVETLITQDAFIASIKPLFNLTREKFEVRSASTLLPGTTVDLKAKPLEVVTAANINDIQTRKAVIYIWGSISYTDVFHVKHKTLFCSYLRPDLIGYSSCDRHNEAD
jgi:hypothetical protein